MNSKSSALEISGGVRPMAARWVVTGQMSLVTAAHFGGESNTSVDMAVLRDPKEGRPLLPGSSLAGALRSHLADVLGGYRSANEDRNVAVLFGTSRCDDQGSQSPLIVFDAIGVFPDDIALDIRDGVAIDPTTGTADAHKKFDMEVLPAGALFPVRVELIIENAALESRLMSLLAKTLEGLGKGDIALGMRRSRGLGAVKVRNWKARRYDLTIQKGWHRWLTTDHMNPIPEAVPTHESPWKAIQTAYSALTLEDISDQRERVVIDLDVKIAGDILVRSPANDPSAPDVVHLANAGRPILSGTSLAGALRSHALRIARLVRSPAGDAAVWIDRLFGDRQEQHSGTDVPEKRISASKLRVSESFIRESIARRQTRIAVDRFTGGVVKGALFDEEVRAGGRLVIQIELRNPLDGETGLLLLVLKDLLSGKIPVGGAVSVGRGILKGTAFIRVPGGKAYTIGSDLTVEKDALLFFNSRIKAFHEADSLLQKEMR